MEDGVIDCDACSSDSDSDSDSGRGWDAANAAVAVAAISGGGGGAGAAPPPAYKSGYREPVPRPTTEWVDRMLKVLRPSCGTSIDDTYD